MRAHWSEVSAARSHAKTLSTPRRKEILCGWRLTGCGIRSAHLDERMGGGNRVRAVRATRPRSANSRPPVSRFPTPGSRLPQNPKPETRGRVAQRAAASDRCVLTGVRSRQPDLTPSREVRNAANRFFVGCGFASFFAPLRGTNPPCLRLPATVRSNTALTIRAPLTSHFALRTSHFGVGPSPFDPENGRTGLAKTGTRNSERDTAFALRPSRACCPKGCGLRSMRAHWSEVSAARSHAKTLSTPRRKEILCGWRLLGVESVLHISTSGWEGRNRVRAVRATRPRSANSRPPVSRFPFPDSRLPQNPKPETFRQPRSRSISGGFWSVARTGQSLRRRWRAGLRFSGNPSGSSTSITTLDTRGGSSAIW